MSCPPKNKHFYPNEIGFLSEMIFPCHKEDDASQPVRSIAVKIVDVLYSHWLVLISLSPIKVYPSDPTTSDRTVIVAQTRIDGRIETRVVM